ncbi:MAG: DUF1318 domain-containing protein [Nitrospinae bacterium]|nr:DUF1318 domain-containing protein [Nitrospinota bacterium]
MRRPSLHHCLLPLSALAALGMVACAVISGRVQFPNQAVRAVLERLETEPSLLGQTSSAVEDLTSRRIGATAGLEPTVDPNCPKAPIWRLVGTACAQEATRPTLPPDPELALIEELSRMPELREALSSRKIREPFIREWKRDEIIGEAKDGRVAFITDRREVDREILARVSNENDDRRIIARAMATAVVAINGVEPVEKLIIAQMPATWRELAAVRRRLSLPGTWIQLPDGQWVKK